MQPHYKQVLKIILQVKLVTKNYEAKVVRDFINNFSTYCTRMPLLKNEFESMHVKAVNVREEIHVVCHQVSHLSTILFELKSVKK